VRPSQGSATSPARLRTRIRASTPGAVPAYASGAEARLKGAVVAVRVSAHAVEPSRFQEEESSLACSPPSLRSRIFTNIQQKRPWELGFYLHRPTELCTSSGVAKIISSGPLGREPPARDLPILSPTVPARRTGTPCRRGGGLPAQMLRPCSPHRRLCPSGLRGWQPRTQRGRSPGPTRRAPRSPGSEIPGEGFRRFRYKHRSPQVSQTLLGDAASFRAASAI
jgi:hypothetical protein